VNDKEEMFEDGDPLNDPAWQGGGKSKRRGQQKEPHIGCPIAWLRWVWPLMRSPEQLVLALLLYPALCSLQQRYDRCAWPGRREARAQSTYETPPTLPVRAARHLACAGAADRTRHAGDPVSKLVARRKEQSA
jgi:hypothetical protein